MTEQDRESRLPGLGLRRGLLAFAAALLLMMAPGSALSQTETSTPGDLTRSVRGKVVDAETGLPLASVWVQEADEDRGTISGPTGNFELIQVPVAGAWITFEQLGYFTETIWVEPISDDAMAAGGVAIIEAALKPDAIVLEGLSVVVDQMGRRRNAVTVPVQSVQGNDLWFSPYPSALEHIEARFGIRTVRCPGSALAYDCAWVRGRPTRVSVWVDENPMAGGLDYLDVIPPFEIHTIEIYGRGRQIRVYTEMFMDRLAKHPRTLMPIMVN